MGKKDIEKVRREIQDNNRNPSFIKVKEFFYVGPYLRREFHRPMNTEIDLDNQTISFDVEEWATMTSIRLTKKLKEIETVQF